MKAAWIEQYGGPDVVRFGERPMPQAGPRDVLVAVKAASVNPIDRKLRQGLLRQFFPLTFPYILGRDMSGVVIEAGAEATGFKPGDEVFGMADALRGGTHAEIAVTDGNLLALKPKRLTHVEAASLPLIGASAIVALEETGRLRAGERVLIHGGAGGVGGFAVQLAKHLGAEVVATCRGAAREEVLGLGATRAIDYAREDFAVLLSGLDIVLDTVGGAVHARSLRVLKPGGRLVYLVGDEPVPDEAPPAGVNVMRANVRGRRDLFERIARLADDGAVQPRVAAVLPLSEAARAYEMSHTGENRGKIVLEVAR